MATAPISVAVTINPRDIARINKRLDKWQGKPLEVRLDKATGAGMKLYIGALRAAAPLGATGNLRRSIAVRKLRKRRGEVAAYKAGPGGQKGAHRHLVIQGHEIVGHRPDRVRTGQFTKKNPFVDRVYVGLEPAVTAFIAEQVTRLA